MRMISGAPFYEPGDMFICRHKIRKGIENIDSQQNDILMLIDTVADPGDNQSRIMILLTNNGIVTSRGTPGVTPGFWLEFIPPMKGK